MKHEPEYLVRQILEHIGEDPGREGLKDTPKRVIKAWAEIFGGYKEDPAKVLQVTFERGNYTGPVILRDIDFVSTCEHHMLPFIGKAHVGYYPGDRVVGLSKLARLVDIYARRLQIQEKMTQQICETLYDATKASGAAVMIEGQHFCMVCRGVQKQGAKMVTTSFKGVMLQDHQRREFLEHCRQ